MLMHMHGFLRNESFCKGAGLLIFIIVSKWLLIILQRTDKYMAELGVTKRGICM